MKPTKIHITLEYDCPKCTLAFDICYEIVSKIKKTYCPYCKSLIKFSGVEIPQALSGDKVIEKPKKRPSLKADIKPKAKPDVKQDVKLDTKPDIKIETCVSILSNLGYKNSDAKQITKNFLTSYAGGDSDDELIKNLMGFINK